MAYSETKSYVITAPSAGIADLMTAIYDHFNSAPGLWRLKSGAGSSNTGIVIEPKSPLSGYNLGISIRRNGTTNFQVALDPLNSYTAAGNSSGGPTGGSAQASGDITQIITNIAYTKFAICEYPDAIMILFFTASRVGVAQAPHIGRTIDPTRESYRSAPLLCNGLAVQVGLPTFSVSLSGNVWFASSAPSRIRCNGGWHKLYPVGYSNVNSMSNPIPDSPNPNRAVVVAPMLGCYVDASTNYLDILLPRYFGRIGFADSICKVAESDTEDEAWLYVNCNDFVESASGKYVVSWEKGVVAPT
jgi:hypothetical protein